MGRRKAQNSGNLQVYSAVLPPIEEKQEGFEEFLDAILIGGQPVPQPQAIPPAPPLPQNLGGGGGNPQAMPQPAPSQNPSAIPNPTAALPGAGVSQVSDSSSKGPVVVPSPPGNNNSSAGTSSRPGSLYSDLSIVNPAVNSDSSQSKSGETTAASGSGASFDFSAFQPPKTQTAHYTFTDGTTTITNYGPANPFVNNQKTPVNAFSPTPSLVGSQPMSVIGSNPFSPQLSSWTPPEFSSFEARFINREITNKHLVGVGVSPYSPPPPYPQSHMQSPQRPARVTPSAPREDPRVDFIDLRGEASGQSRTGPEPRLNIAELENFLQSAAVSTTAPTESGSQEFKDEINRIFEAMKQQQHRLQEREEKLQEALRLRKEELPREQPLPAPRRPPRSNPDVRPKRKAKASIPAPGAGSPVLKHRVQSRGRVETVTEQPESSDEGLEAEDHQV